MSWTEKKVNKLKDLWGKGQTASQIAEILGGVSRNAEIGKAHRLNLSSKIKTRSVMIQVMCCTMYDLMKVGARGVLRRAAVARSITGRRGSSRECPGADNWTGIHMADQHERGGGGDLQRRPARRGD